MPDLIGNERIKLFASWCNTIAASIITVGVFTPLAINIYGLGEPPKNAELLAGLPWVCICAAVALHLGGRSRWSTWTTTMTNSDIVALLMPLAATGAVLLTGVAVIFHATHRKSARKRKSGLDQGLVINARTRAPSEFKPWRDLSAEFEKSEKELAALLPNIAAVRADEASATPNSLTEAMDAARRALRQVAAQESRERPNILAGSYRFSSSQKTPAEKAADEYRETLFRPRMPLPDPATLASLSLSLTETNLLTRLIELELLIARRGAEPPSPLAAAETQK
jgi:hypothetical protein